MGGVVQTLFGGSSNKSSSNQGSTSTSLANSTSHSETGNHAYDYLMNALSGNVTTGNNAMGTIASLLGQGGDKAGADEAFKNYLGSSGYNFMMDQGSKAITGSKAASGMLNSGSTLKALTSFGQGLGSQYFGNYLNQLGSLVQGGLASAGQIGGAGGYSTGDSSSNSSSTSNSWGTSTGKGSSSNGILPVLFG